MRYKLAATAFAVLALAGCRIPASESRSSDRYESDLEPLLRDVLRRQEIPGFAIAIVDGDRIVYAKGFGVLDENRKKDPVTTRSLFHMASITKPFVATAVMQLVARGRMSLDAPITTYLPYFRVDDPRAASITVRQMLTHTSGMPDVADYEWDKPQYDDAALERYVRRLAKERLVFAPGERFQYSNMAYEVLGDAVAKASGGTLEEAVHAGILVPLGMRDSTLLVERANARLMTWGHELDADGHPSVSKVYPYNRTHTPSSNLHSNVLDMSRWAMAYLDGGELEGTRILSREARDLMWTPARPIGAAGPDSRREAIGISWFLGRHRGHRLVSHGGGDTGYATDLVLLPDDGKAVVWMANVDWIDHDPFSRAALDAALGMKPEPIAARRGMYGVLTAAYRRGGVDAALARRAELAKDASGLWESGEADLNQLGYFLLGEKKPDEAVRVFRANVDAFPKSANARDSLGEAYEAAGDRAAALTAYEEAVRLDPGLTHAADAVKKLR